jgi:imidazolonepropionase-like amidohydrolase
MNPYFVRALLFFILASAHARPLALVGGRLIDGFGGHPLANSVIIIDNERVTAVGTVGALQVPADAEVISTEGMDVLPGLWDCHVHTMILGHSDYAYWDKTYPPRLGGEIMPAAARQLLMAGVTSARDLGGPLKESISLRDRINRGEIPGPTLYVAGPFISTSRILVPITSAGASKARPMAKLK